MAEMITSVEAKTPIIYPLFYSISVKRFREAEKQREWSAKWASWNMDSRHKKSLEQWKATMKKIGETTGVEKPPFMSDVEYRKIIEVHIKKMLEIKNEKAVSGSVVSRGKTPPRSGVVIRGVTSRPGVATRGKAPSSGSTSRAGVSGTATQPSNVVASSGSAGRQCGERFGVGLPIGLGVGVGQGIGLELTEDVLHYFSPAEDHPPSPPSEDTGSEGKGSGDKDSEDEDSEDKGSEDKGSEHKDSEDEGLEDRDSEDKVADDKDSDDEDSDDDY